MRRLLAAVVLIDQTGHGIKITRVHGRGQPVNHFGHQALPPGSQAMAPTCLAMVPAVAQALQRLPAAAMAYPSRPGNTAPVTCGPAGTGANEAGVNINLPTMDDKPGCLGSRSCMSGLGCRADHLRAASAMPSHSGRRA
jgi:hypothetical protein